MEAAGGYERKAFLLLWEEGLPCAVTNARYVRQYAESMGVLEKTDRIDARSRIQCWERSHIAPKPT